MNVSPGFASDGTAAVCVVCLDEVVQLLELEPQLVEDSQSLLDQILALLCVYGDGDLADWTRRDPDLALLRDDPDFSN